MADKPTKIIFLDEAEEIYQRLLLSCSFSKAEHMLLSAIDQKVSLLKYNYRYGDTIAKRLIPPEYKIKYNVTTLFRVELPLFWRMLYTLTHDETSIIVFIVDILDHKAYNKKFGYRGH